MQILIASKTAEQIDTTQQRFHTLERYCYSSATALQVSSTPTSKLRWWTPFDALQSPHTCAQLRAKSHAGSILRDILHTLAHRAQDAGYPGSKFN